MMSLRPKMAVALVVPAVLSAAPLSAQDVRYETVTKLEMPGAAGVAMRMAARLGGGSSETVETTSIKGRKMRTDAENTSTIVDLDQQRFVWLDHDAKTYTTYTFDELLQKSQEAAAAAQRDAQQASGTDDARARLDFRFSVEPGNDRQRIAGYDADRFFLTMEAEGAYAPEGQAETQEAGMLVVLVDMLTSTDMPAFRAKSAFDDASAQQYAEAGAAMTQAMAAMFAEDPSMQVAFEQSVSEARKIEGMPVRTVTTFVSVAPGQRFDRARVTEPAAESRGPSVAEAAGRAAMGRLGGMLGGRNRQQAEPEPAEASQPTQATIFSVTSEIRNVSTDNLDASLFEIPAGYREQPQ